MIERDLPNNRKVINSEITYRGNVWEIAKETFEFRDTSLTRDFLKHPGAVAVLAINQKQEALLISQYRHPIGQTMVEIPAGLLDDEMEEPLAAAKRELLEEAGYVAHKWSVLLDFCTTPGSSSEAIRIFLATDLELNPDENYIRTGEEAEIKVWFEPLGQVASKILAGEIQSPTAVGGVLAYLALQHGGEFREANADWQIRDHLIATNRVFKF